MIPNFWVVSIKSSNSENLHLFQQQGAASQAFSIELRPEVDNGEKLQKLLKRPPKSPVQAKAGCPMLLLQEQQHCCNKKG